MTITETAMMANTAQQYTAPLTAWPMYQKIEAQENGGGQLWTKAEKLTDLSSVAKVWQTANKAHESIEKGSAFAKKPYLLCQWKAVTKESAYATHMDYAKKFEASQREVVELSKAVANYAKDSQAWQTNAAGTLDKIQNAASNLTAMQEELNAKKAELKAQPIASDWRIQPSNMGALQTAWDLGDYDSLLQRWSDEGHINPEVSNRSCWEWLGQKGGLHQVKAKLTHLAHALHTVACAADALQTHGKNANFMADLAECKKEDNECSLEGLLKMMLLGKMMGRGLG